MPNIISRITSLFRGTDGTADATTNATSTASTTGTNAVHSHSTVDQPVTDSADRVRASGVRASEVAAVKEFRQLFESDKLRDYYDAVIGRKDDVALKTKAMDLFERLPKINSTVRADELVELGLWTVAPRGIDKMLESPRYLPGRRLLVPAPVEWDLWAPRGKFLTYKSLDDGGKIGVTPRAILAGEDGNDFLVQVDGADKLIKVSKSEVFKYNHPNTFEKRLGGGRRNPDELVIAGGGYVFGRCDYAEPLTKAKICEVALRMDKTVGKIDFNKALAGDVMGKTPEARETTALQREAVRAVHKCVDMSYYKSSRADSYKSDHRPHAARVSAGRAAIRGTGKCHDHAAVNLSLLSPFAKILGIDIKMYYGHCYRAHKKGDNPFVHKSMPDGESTGHSWMHLSFRPALNDERVCDKTWRQPDIEADRAYTSLYGDRYPNRGWFIPDTIEVSPTDVNFSGDVTVNTPQVIMSQANDGRQNHMSNAG